MDYAFAFEGHGVFTPDGRVDIQTTDVDASNKAKEQAELEWLKTHPDRLFLYVGRNTENNWTIQTWLGTVLSNHVDMGERRQVGFGMHTYRRSVRVRLFKQLYVGWYMESSGDYCRLRKAKQQ